MTVGELIERLQGLPGASASRQVTLRVDAHREKKQSIKCEVRNITSVRIEHDAAIVEGWGWDDSC